MKEVNVPVPDTVADSVIVSNEPTQVDVGVQVIAPASGRVLTVIVSTTVVVPQLFVFWYEITEVPVAMAVTTPPDVIVAMLVAELDQVPPVAVSASVVEPPGQSTFNPVIAGTYGKGLTVITVLSLIVVVPKDVTTLVILNVSLTAKGVVLVITPNPRRFIPVPSRVVDDDVPLNV